MRRDFAMPLALSDLEMPQEGNFTDKNGECYYSFPGINTCHWPWTRI